MTTSPTALTHAVFPPEGVVLTFDDERVSYADLAVVSMLSGQWEPFLKASARGDHLTATGQADGIDLRHAAERFRRVRRLEAAEDLKEWLTARGLSSAQWRRALERLLTVSSHGSVDDEPPDSPRLEPTPDVLHADAFCTGLWERSAQRVAAWLAATSLERDGRPPTPLEDIAQSARELGVPADRVQAISCWHSAFECIRTRVASDEAVARLVRSHELDWTTFAFDELSFGTRSQACEALLCCRDDGLEPEDVLARSDGRLETRSARSDTLPTAVAAEFLTTDIEGRVIGPFEAAAGWSVLRLTGRCRPSAEDPEVHAAAVTELLNDALDGEAAGRIRWIGPT